MVEDHERAGTEDGPVAYMRWTGSLEKPCPRCLIGPLVLRSMLVADPTGTYSLAGAQAKVSAALHAVLSCETPGCTFLARGRLEGATVSEDGSSFTGGHFVGREVVPDAQSAIAAMPRCRHCGDHTDPDDDPRPDLCDMCQKAGRA